MYNLTGPGKSPKFAGIEGVFEKVGSFQIGKRVN